MNQNPKLQIYKGIIQYLLETTHYNLNTIADLSNASIKSIRSIYCDEHIPPNFSSEMQLVKLYHAIIELKAHGLHNPRGC